LLSLIDRAFRLIQGYRKATVPVAPFFDAIPQPAPSAKKNAP